jgi:hypothetical protein
MAGPEQGKRRALEPRYVEARLPRPALRVPTAPGDRVFRTDRPLRPCLPGGHGQRTTATARQASRSLSPAYSALTRLPSPLAVSIMSHGVSHPHSRDAFVIATASPRTHAHPPSGFPLGIATVQIPMLWELCDRSSTVLIPRSRRDLAPRQTICIAGPLKSPPAAHPGKPSRSHRCHYGSIINSPPWIATYVSGCCACSVTTHWPRRSFVRDGTSLASSRGTFGNTFVIATLSAGAH